jgi:ABC-type dipeptide/oligopeptide/nickel transport system permease component
VVAFAFELVIGGIAGLLAALRRGSFMDNLVLVSTTAPSSPSRSSCWATSVSW